MNTVPRINPAAAQPVRAQDVDQREWETRVDLAACYRLVELYLKIILKSGDSNGSWRLSLRSSRRSLAERFAD